LRRQGYAPGTIWKHRKLLNELSGWLQGQQLTMGDLSMAQVDRFLADRRAAVVRKLKTRKALDPILSYSRRLGLAPAAEAPVKYGPAGEILNRYRQFLTAERGLVPVTGFGYVNRLRPFLDRRLSPAGLDLGSLTPADVTSVRVEFCPRLNGGVAKLTVSALRSFLGFLHVHGITERSLVSAVPTVLRRRLAGLPKGLNPIRFGAFLRPAMSARLLATAIWQF